MANAHVDIDLSGVTSKLSPAAFNRARKTTANQILMDMDRFIPKRDDKLRESGHLTAQDDLEWNTVYARAQFYGFVTARDGSQHRVHNYTTPGTSRRWDLRAKASYGKSWAGTFAKGLNL